MSVIKVNKPLIVRLSIVLDITLVMSVVCVKLRSGHTYEMHSVFFGKTGGHYPTPLSKHSKYSFLQFSFCASSVAWVYRWGDPILTYQGYKTVVGYRQ
jgi:uncharacterized membrane protein YeiB